jgi:PIN domain nuclease of toxin-antitoxin system
VQIICIDTGVLSIYFSKDITKEVSDLIDKVKKGIVEAHILKPVLVEVFHHLCRVKGLDFAKTTIVSFMNQVPFKEIDLNTPLIIKAGTLKCQNPKKLSYIDCMCIAYALNMKIPLHTTEKTLNKLAGTNLQNLKTVKYSFID